MLADAARWSSCGEVAESFGFQNLFSPFLISINDDKICKLTMYLYFLILFIIVLISFIFILTFIFIYTIKQIT